MSNELYRETAAHLHRSVAIQMAVQAWLSGVNCIVFNYGHLNKLLRVQSMKDTRVDWFLEDVVDWFPFHQIVNHGFVSPNQSIPLFLSAVEMEANAESSLSWVPGVPFIYFDYDSIVKFSNTRSWLDLVALASGERPSKGIPSLTTLPPDLM